MSESDPIRVFATHAFQETDDYLRVFEFLESADRFFYINVARPENIPTTGGIDAIRNELVQQIKLAEAMIVLPSLYEEKGDLVRFMMDAADANNIGMIAIRPFGHVAETPKEIVDRVQDHVEWNEREMVDALKRQARGEDTQRWETIDFPGWDADGEIEE